MLGKLLLENFPEIFFLTDSEDTTHRFFKIAFLIALSTNFTFSQWSTSAKAESALYVCPGFFPDITTFTDGSSIILGAVDSYIYAQKLDSLGNKLWSLPIEAHHNDSSFITWLQAPFLTRWGGSIDDGSGGVIFFWYDHRDGYRNVSDGHWFNNAIYVQRLDQEGKIKYLGGGLKLVGPESGLKFARIVEGDSGSFIIVWTEAGFEYTGAPNKQYLKAACYDAFAQIRWMTPIDSSFIESDAFFLYDIQRGGDRIYISYYANDNHSRIIDIDGNIVTPLRGKVFYAFSSDRSGNVFASYFPGENQVIKYGSNGDTAWTAILQLSDSCQALGGYFVPDDSGGTYYLNTCQDSIIRILSSGLSEKIFFEGIGYGGRAMPDGRHGLVLTSSTTAKRYDQFGQMQWPNPVIFLEDPENIEFVISRPDYNGGAIEAFWTVFGGIRSLHTGRDGQRGIINDVRDGHPIPTSAQLFQNYPNPFNPNTSISYFLPQRGEIKIRVFDVLGRFVAPVFEMNQGAGYHTFDFDGTKLSSGVYFYSLEIENKISLTRKMLLVR